MVGKIAILTFFLKKQRVRCTDDQMRHSIYCVWKEQLKPVVVLWCRTKTSGIFSLWLGVHWLKTIMNMNQAVYFNVLGEHVFTFIKTFSWRLRCGHLFSKMTKAIFIWLHTYLIDLMNTQTLHLDISSKSTCGKNNNYRKYELNRVKHVKMEPCLKWKFPYSRRKGYNRLITEDELA